MKEKFEEWIIRQFGPEAKVLLDEGFNENGYVDETINAMWIGFNGHAWLTGSGNG